MCKDVLEQRVDHGNGVHSGYRHNAVLDVDGDRERAALLFAQRRPVGRPFFDDLDKIASRVDFGANRPSALSDDEVGGPFEFVEIVDDPVSRTPRRECLGVQLRSGERCSESVGKVGGRLSLLLEQVLDLFRKEVELGTHFLDLGRTRRGDPSSEVPLLETGRGDGELVARAERSTVRSGRLPGRPTRRAPRRDRPGSATTS